MPKTPNLTNTTEKKVCKCNDLFYISLSPVFGFFFFPSMGKRALVLELHVDIVAWGHFSLQASLCTEADVRQRCAAVCLFVYVGWAPLQVWCEETLSCREAPSETDRRERPRFSAIPNTGVGWGVEGGGWLIPVRRWRPEDSQAFSFCWVNEEGWYWFPSTTLKTNVAFTFRVGALALALALFKSTYASKQPSESITRQMAHLAEPLYIDMEEDTHQPLYEDVIVQH